MSGKRLDLTPEQIEEFKETFYLFDKDGDGTITATELDIVMRTLGQNPTEAELKHMIDEVDGDGSGCIEIDEFLELMDKKMKEQDTEEEIIEAFKAFDRDGDGYINENDLKDFLKTFGETISDNEIQKMIQVADSSRDGKVNYQNFVRMMMIPK